MTKLLKKYFAEVADLEVCFLHILSAQWNKMEHSSIKHAEEEKR